MCSTPRTAPSLLPLLLLSACATTTVTTRSWGAEPAPSQPRYGRVESIQETVVRREGNPVAGAAAGAVIGGLVGSAIGSYTTYDRWGRAYTRSNPAGALVGAVGGAMVGAAASQGSAEERRYDLTVRFEDGSAQQYAYRGSPPFAVGDTVALGPRGLFRVPPPTDPVPPEGAPGPR